MNQNMNLNFNQNQNQNQSPNKIQNPKTETPNTPQMNDRDFINDMLATCKYMTDSYSTALNEASHEGLYQDLSMIFKETKDTHRNLYDLMFKKGWYSVEAAQEQRLQQDYQQFQKYTSQFPYSNNMIQ